jgi:hypothetical protein
VLDCAFCSIQFLLLVILIINKNGIDTLKLKCHAPVSINANRIMIDQVLC